MAQVQCSSKSYKGIETQLCWQWLKVYLTEQDIEYRTSSVSGTQQNVQLRYSVTTAQHCSLCLNLLCKYKFIHLLYMLYILIHLQDYIKSVIYITRIKELASL